MKLIDTHAHLEDIEDLEGALDRAERANVIAIITMGYDYKSNLWVIKESQKYCRKTLRIYPALGVHPWVANKLGVDDALKLVKKNVRDAVAVGEIGLDYWYKEVRKNPEARKTQLNLFRRLLELARDHGKTVSIHSRGAWRDCLNITLESGVEKAVFHWFSGPLDVLDGIVEHGYFISATPAAAYSREHRLAIKNAPIENILLETDSPVSYRGDVAEPAYVLRSLSAVAELKGLSKEAVAEQTLKNARNLFNI